MTCHELSCGSLSLKCIYQTCPEIFALHLVSQKEKKIGLIHPIASEILGIIMAPRKQLMPVSLNEYCFPSGKAMY